ncbi:hypothetical protein EJ08DRAFT_590367 [Tothia fuscella]|uniref:Sodium bile acid cotransporter n=1 Tax=Tothia fuscella TaxID=1048955 RepID=A0A9P4TXL2_9PEZI|nr:hypothetical protein EJ08DRAFT_590367 [Tothia fuscella]
MGIEDIPTRNDDLIHHQAPSRKSSTSTESPIPSTKSNNKASFLRRTGNAILYWLKDQWFLVALACLIAIASQYQVPLGHQSQKSTIVTYLCVAIIFFMTGCTLSTRTLIENYARWKLHLFVQVQCFLLTSVLCFAVVSGCARNRNFMDPGLLIGLLFTGCVPTTISSNVVMTRQAHGNVALTVVQSTLGNLLGPFLTPVLIYMYNSGGEWYTKVLPEENGSFELIYRRVFKQLGLSIFVPLFVGQMIQNLFPTQTSHIFTKYKLNKLGSICLLVVIWSTYDQSFSTGAFTSVKPSNVIFVVFISIALLILLLTTCFTLSMLWLPKADTISVCYCVPAKTPAMGVPLAHVMFVGISAQLESKIQIPLVIYQGLQIVGGSLLTVFFRRWIERQEEAAVEVAATSVPALAPKNGIVENEAERKS